MIYIDGKVVGFNYDSISSLDNIDIYKFLDLQNIIQNGGSMASNEEYTEAEGLLQTLYQNIMIGGTINA